MTHSALNMCHIIGHVELLILATMSISEKWMISNVPQTGIFFLILELFKIFLYTHKMEINQDLLNVAVTLKLILCKLEIKVTSACTRHV